MSLTSNGFYRFGEFTVDPEQKVLLRDGARLALPPKIFDTLLILVDNSGRIVQKEELMKRLWPDTFVEESNLTFNIQQLRKALGDDARHPRFIETVPRRGYRFIAEVNENLAQISNPEPRIAITKPAQPKVLKRSYLTFAVLGVLAVAAVVVASWFGRGRSAATSSSAPVLSTPFKSEKFASGGFVKAALSPNGKYVAYTSETGGKESIWLRQLETSENIQIVPPTDERYLSLTISHDGNSLYFVRVPLAEPLTSAIYRVMTFGGIPVRITEKTEGAVSLSPDDKQLSFIRCHYHEDDFCSLYVVDADGKNERKLLTRQRPIRLSGAQFSPDGKSIALASGQSSTGGSDFRLMRLDLASGTESELASRSFFNIRNLKWLPDGEGLLLTASETLDGLFRIWHVSAATGEARALTKDATDYNSLSMNQSADKLIATHIRNTFHLYFATIDDLNNPKNLSVARTGIAFAPDGKLVYEGDDGDIWMINANGGEQRQLTKDALKDYLPRVSPDGRHIFYSSTRSGSNHVWRMSADGSNQIQITKTEGGYPRFITADGKWVYFESGLNQTLWRVPADGGAESQIFQHKVYESAFSPDGKWVAYLFRAPNDSGRFSLAVDSLSEPGSRKVYKLGDERARLLTLAWGPDNKTFYYVTSAASRSSLWRQSLSDERPVLVGDLGDDEVAHLAVSPDGTRIGFIRGRWVHDAVLIEGLK
jgi:Tol biopolymer transport system component/DNA-binding winged helix-turn-helix (wHTH) protein